MKKLSLIPVSFILILLIISSFVFTGSKFAGSNDTEIIYNYSDLLDVTSERQPDSEKRLFQFRNISEHILIVKLTPYKYRPYLNEFDPLPEELFTKEGYDNYLEFELEPGDIQWREFIVDPVNVWKLNIGVGKKKEK